MKAIDKLKPVMVTGATGYVAGWLVKKLLENGLTVHAAIRDPKDEKKVAHLNRLAENSSGNIKYFKADLLSGGTYQEAMKGCELVYHTASPFITDIKDPYKELLDPAEKGTENVLRSASETSSVKRVVVTSSCAAIYTDAVDCEKAKNGILTEEIWNTTSSADYLPYFHSKLIAEKKAWEVSKEQTQWDLVTINPSLVLGPALNPHTTNSESFNILKQLGDGTMKYGVPRMGLGLVDVRDVAEAHFQAGFNPKAEGRYITSAHNTDILEMSSTLLPKFGDEFPLPKRAMPKWLLMLIGPLANKLFTKRFVRNNVDKEFKADNSKIQNDLSVKFRPLHETMEDSFQMMVDEKML